jgi:hypothetical protein
MKVLASDLRARRKRLQLSVLNHYAFGISFSVDNYGLCFRFGSRSYIIW